MAVTSCDPICREEDGQIRERIVATHDQTTSGFSMQMVGTCVSSALMGETL